MKKQTLIDAVATEVTKEFVDRGKLIEAGFAAFAHMVIPKDAPPLQTSEMRFAFMAGAEHLFSSIMVMLDPGEEPTDKDLQRMDLIGNEIEAWRKTLEQRMPRPK